MRLHTVIHTPCLFLVISFALQIGLTTATKSEEIRQQDVSSIHFKEERLSVAIKNQPFKKVMDEISKKAGRPIVIKDETNDKLTANFDYLPLEEGLKRLLKGKNYVFFYGNTQTDRNFVLTQVLVLPGSGSSEVTGTEADINGETVSKEKVYATELQELDIDTLVDNDTLDELLKKIATVDAKEIQIMMQNVAERFQKIEVSSEELHRVIENALQELPLSEENFTSKRGTQGLIMREGDKKLSE